MATITVYLMSGQTFTYEGTYDQVRAPGTNELISHKFAVDARSGMKIPFVRVDAVAAVTEKEDWT